MKHEGDRVTDFNWCARNKGAKRRRNQKQIETIQTKALSKSSRKLRKVLET